MKRLLKKNKTEKKKKEMVKLLMVIIVTDDPVLKLETIVFKSVNIFPVHPTII